VGENWRHLQRYPAVYPVGPGKDRPKQIGGTGQILQGQLEEQILWQLCAGGASGNVAVVIGAVLYRVIEDCRIRG
jgi:hypothetical protein